MPTGATASPRHYAGSRTTDAISARIQPTWGIGDAAPEVSVTTWNDVMWRTVTYSPATLSATFPQREREPAIKSGADLSYNTLLARGAVRSEHRMTPYPFVWRSLISRSSADRATRTSDVGGCRTPNRPNPLLGVRAPESAEGVSAEIPTGKRMSCGRRASVYDGA
jgi:hypothetical protein